MKGRKIKEKGGSARGMYIQSTSDIPPKGVYIRSSYIPPNWHDMRSIADITKLYKIPNPFKKSKHLYDQKFNL
jgi:hypothetical protein